MCVLWLPAQSICSTRGKKFPLATNSSHQVSGTGSGVPLLSRLSVKVFARGGTTQDTGELPEEAQFGGRLAGILLKQKSPRKCPTSVMSSVQMQAPHRLKQLRAIDERKFRQLTS